MEGIRYIYSSLQMAPEKVLCGGQGLSYFKTKESQGCTREGLRRVLLEGQLHICPKVQLCQTASGCQDPVGLFSINAPGWHYYCQLCCFILVVISSEIHSSSLLPFPGGRSSIL